LRSDKCMPRTCLVGVVWTGPEDVTGRMKQNA
jgi:hypothetical protein